MENTQVGPFKIIKRLGTNRRQKVYHARQTEQGRDVALKFISVPPDIEWTKALQKIQREVEVLKQLEHPNLVQVYGAGAADDKIFFANELVKGESLAAILSRRGKLAPDLAVEYGRQISHLLEYLHNKEIIHSKLTPEKILVTSDHQVMVADLRLNRSKRRRWDSSRQRELEIAAYMAPEQFTEGATHKSDFYALGVIIYEMLTGKLPYPPDTMGRMTRNKMNAPVPSVATHVMNCPIWLDQIVTQMLQPDPKKRPHSARAIVLAFDEIKKIDQTQKAAVSQVSGKFNPLNAGKDKSEANRLLGKKQPRKKSDTPIHQSTPFLIACLLIIAAIIGLAMIPPSSENLLTQGEDLMESKRIVDWRKARGFFEQVIERNDSPELVSRADDLYQESRRRTLIQQAEQGFFLLSQSAQAKTFGEAVKLQQIGKQSEALQLFNRLVETVDPNGEERYIRIESQHRIEMIAASEPDLPRAHEQLLIMIESTGDANSESELISAQRLLSRIILEFAGEEDYQTLVSQTKTQLEHVKRLINDKTESKEEPEDSDPSTAPAPDTNNSGPLPTDEESDPLPG